MNNLKVASINGQLVTDIRDVAEMIGREGSFKLKNRQLIRLSQGKGFRNSNLLQLVILETKYSSGCMKTA